MLDERILPKRVLFFTLVEQIKVGYAPKNELILQVWRQRSFLGRFLLLAGLLLILIEVVVAAKLLSYGENVSSHYFGEIVVVGGFDTCHPEGTPDFIVSVQPNGQVWRAVPGYGGEQHLRLLNHQLLR